MTPSVLFQKQTKFGGADSPKEEIGNCFSTCIASLFGLPTTEVPNFCDTKRWRERVDKWLEERGFVIVTYNEDPFKSAPELHSSVPMIASGMGPRGHRHSVLWQKGKLLWDPHPSGEGLIGYPEELEIIVFSPKSKHKSSPKQDV